MLCGVNDVSVSVIFNLFLCIDVCMRTCQIVFNYLQLKWMKWHSLQASLPPLNMTVFWRDYGYNHLVELITDTTKLEH